MAAAVPLPERDGDHGLGCLLDSGVAELPRLVLNSPKADPLPSGNVGGEVLSRGKGGLERHHSELSGVEREGGFCWYVDFDFWRT